MLLSGQKVIGVGAGVGTGVGAGTGTATGAGAGVCTGAGVGVVTGAVMAVSALPITASGRQSPQAVRVRAMVKAKKRKKSRFIIHSKLPANCGVDVIISDKLRRVNT